MKKVILIIISVCFCSIAFSQSEENYTQEEGKVTQYEMSMTEYPDDKDAEAVVLYELGDYFFRGEEDGFHLYMHVSKKIKILSQAGIEYADMEIPYYISNSGVEKIYDIEATTYNYVDGKLNQTKLLSSNIFEEKINDKWRKKKFAMPDVKVGSVIEIRYKIETPFFFNMREWKFQKEIPVVHSKLKYKAIPYYVYTFILKGSNNFDESDSKVLPREIHYGTLSYKELEYNWGMKNIPAFKDEDFVSSKDDYMILMNFQLSTIYYPSGGKKEIMTTWPKLNDEFLKEDYFGKYIKNSEKEAKKILPAIDLANKNQDQQVEAITDYVKYNYNWNSSSSKFASQKASDFIKKKSGNSADINLFLIGLLKAANIQAEPVILSTRGNGMISQKYPFQNFFNYVIAMVQVEENKYFIDATEPLMCYKELPTRCINVRGLVIKPKAEEWVFTEQKNIAETERKLNIKIQPDSGIMNVDATFAAFGNDAYRYRRVYLDKKENLKDYLLKNMNVDCKGEIEVKENTDMGKPFEFSFNFNHGIGKADNKLFIQPFCNLSMSSNAFKQTSRALAVDLIHVSGNKYTVTIEIPEGYEVEYLPKELNHDSKYMLIKYSAEQVENKIEVNAEYRYKTNLYPAESYMPLKACVAGIIKQFSEIIILVKK